MNSNLFTTLKGILLTFLLLGFGNLALAQATISGTVSDSDSKDPLIGATILVKESPTIGTITNTEGGYSLTLKAGSYTLQVSYFGYQNAEVSVSVSEGSTTTQDIRMQASVMGLDQVVVTASNTFRSQKQAPLSISAMRQKEITKLNPNSQADILRSIPSITAEGGGGETATNLFIRGLPSGGQYVFNPLQYDGLPLMTTFGLNSSAHDVYARPDIGFKGVEFVRGGASVLYGAGSSAGIINYVSKTGDTDPGNNVNIEIANRGRIKTDFYSGGRLGGEESNTFYAITGFLRY